MTEICNCGLWNGTNELNLDINIKIKKICIVQDTIFLLSISLELYHSFHLDNKSVQFRKYTEKHIIDVATQGTQLYIVDNEGRVFRTANLLDDSEFHEIILEEESKSCTHGFQSHGSVMKVRHIAVGNYGCLYITDRYELWASGAMPEIRIESDHPQKVLFFEGRIITDVAVGNDFAMVLSRKSLKYDRESCSEISENVFVNNCPQCILSSRMSSPVSNDTCPLGLKIDKLSEDCLSISNISTADNNMLLDNKTDGFEDVADEFSTADAISESRTSDEPDKSRSLHSFINSDSARLFLTKQLSWMSAGEEYLADYTEKPTRIIKENVSNLTSLVYEGVKSLSRHMSGGSENGTTDILCRSENNEDAVSKLYDFFESCSTSSDKENTENDSMERASCLIKTGQRLLNSDLWTWGRVNRGQLGTGDQIKRSRPIMVTKLSGLGIKNICCGEEHALALSLDGRVFLWGENNYHQLSPESKTNQSFPKQFDKLVNERVLGACCGARHTSILTHNLKLCYMGKHTEGTTNEIVELYNYVEDSHDDSGISLKKLVHHSRAYEKNTICLNVCNVYASGTYTYCNAISKIPDYVATEQKFLEDLLFIQTYLLKPLFKTLSTNSNDLKAYEILCTKFGDVLYLTALNIESLHLFIENNIDVFEVILVHKIEEMIFIFSEYLNAFCNITSLNGFKVLSKKFEIPPNMKKLYASNKKLKTSEEVFNYVFNYPMDHVPIYKKMTAQLFDNLDFRDKSSIDKQILDLESKWDSFDGNRAKAVQEAQSTRNFWSGSGRTLEAFWSPERRLIKDSHTSPLNVHNAYRFINHWFILLTDIMLHIINGHPSTYDLKTLWIEPLPDTDVLHNGFMLITPEDHITVCTATPGGKSEWVSAIQQAVKGALNKCSTNQQPPVIRIANFTYGKNSIYKEATYSGRWVRAVMNGAGKLKWPEGKTYVGQFQNNLMHGFGIMEYPNIGTYEGHWKDGLQSGNGAFRYFNGDVYKGQFLSGKFHGHGMLKKGHFNSSIASIYVGNFVHGLRSGYGVLDDVANGQKYLGSWVDDKKNGAGLLVTLDGNYYEGFFSQDLLTGNGTVIFEDGSHYEGELKGLNGPGGKGALYIGNRVLEGNLGGTWDNIKITGTLQNIESSSDDSQISTSSPGKLAAVGDSRKWDSIFQQYYTQLGLPYSKEEAPGQGQGRTKNKIWQAISIFMVNSRMENAMRTHKERFDRRTKYDDLETIPSFGMNKLTVEVLDEIKTYLIKAFECPVHPLHYLLDALANAYTFAYGGVIVSPLLRRHAMLELREITHGIYEVISAMFPALPKTPTWMENKVLISPSSILHPLILPRLHSALFVLYALANRENDESYWRRLCIWHVQDNAELMNSLGVDSTFREVVCSESFLEAVECLQQIKTTFCAHHKISVLRNTFKLLRDSVHAHLGADYLMGMDALFPLFLILVIRARLLQLGSEVSIIEDLLEQSGINEATQQPNSPHKQKSEINFFDKNLESDLSQHLGEDDVMITTLKACYHQILQEKIHSH